MHELSIAVDLVDIAQRAAHDANAVRVETVYLRLGVMSGVVKEALFFTYEVATKDTILEGSRLEVTDVPLIVHCATCDKDVELPSIQYFACPTCNTPTTDVRQGRELEIESMEIVTDETEIIGN